MSTDIHVKGSMIVSCKGCNFQYSLQKLIKGVRRGDVVCPNCGTRICKVN